MARIKKKGKAGQAKNFITRTQAVRKLQVSLPDFRRLCIFKGIYPREPRNKKKASRTSGPNTTFYYSKDIQYLLHEPLLAKFREHKAVSKKIARSLGKGEVGDAARLDRIHNKRLSLDHIIKERYPTFVDALRDLDDALSLLFLFANLPSTTTVPPKTVALCQRLCHEFQRYLIVSRSLRKSFISIKGIYYQATIQGQDILWLVPHKFVQRVTGDVDFRIMGTFVEFYTTLLGFVNYRLYSTIGLVYPPKFDARLDEEGGELAALQLENKGLSGLGAGGSHADNMTSNQPTELVVDERAQKLVDGASAVIGNRMADILATDSEEIVQSEELATDAIDTFDPVGSGGDLLLQPDDSVESAGNLFKDMVFFLNREAPRQPLEFLLRASGCKRIGWDSVLGKGAFTHEELDASITHQIVDRPPAMINGMQIPGEDDQDKEGSVDKPKTFQHGHRVPGRIYVQPQWVWDCMNAGKIIRADLYAPGALLPPHLSPFVKSRQGEYDPTKSLAEQEREGEVEEFEEAEKEARSLETAGMDQDQNEELDEPNGTDQEDSDGQMHVDMSDADSEDEEEEEEEEDNRSGVNDNEKLSDEADSDPEDEEAQANAMHQAELEAEAQGISVAEARKRGAKGVLKDPSTNKVRQRAEKKRKAEEEERNRRVGMMPRKKKKLYEKMQYGLKRDNEAATKLRSKRRRLEQADPAK